MQEREAEEKYSEKNRHPPQTTIGFVVHASRH